jgi:hypothetical protein
LCAEGPAQCDLMQIAVLQLFAKTDCLLPNMFVGTLTGKSVTEALNRSITSQMIIKYLEDHRHPKVAHRNPILPSAVKDQVCSGLYCYRFVTHPHTIDIRCLTQLFNEGF